MSGNEATKPGWRAHGTRPRSDPAELAATLPREAAAAPESGHKAVEAVNGVQQALLNFIGRTDAKFDMGHQRMNDIESKVDKVSADVAWIKSKLDGRTWLQTLFAGITAGVFVVFLVWRIVDEHKRDAAHGAPTHARASDASDAGR